MYGALLSGQDVVNTVALNSVGAGRTSFAALGQLEPVAAIVAAPRAQALVLLPYGANEQFGATRLRFAWRISVTADLVGSMPLSQRAFTLWIDAQTGQLLEYAAEAAEDDGGDGGDEAGADDPADAGVQAAPVDMVHPVDAVDPVDPVDAPVAVDAVDPVDAPVDLSPDGPVDSPPPNSSHPIWCRDPSARPARGPVTRWTLVCWPATASS